MSAASDAIRRLDAISGGDPEASHLDADDALYAFVCSIASEVAEAYDRVIEREDGRWWFA